MTETLPTVPVCAHCGTETCDGPCDAYCAALSVHYPDPEETAKEEDPCAA